MRNKYLKYLSTFADVQKEFGYDWTVATVSANNKVSRRVSYHPIVQCTRFVGTHWLNNLFRVSKKTGIGFLWFTVHKQSANSIQC